MNQFFFEPFFFLQHSCNGSRYGIYREYLLSSTENTHNHEENIERSMSCPLLELMLVSFSSLFPINKYKPYTHFHQVYNNNACYVISVEFLYTRTLLCTVQCSCPQVGLISVVTKWTRCSVNLCAIRCMSKVSEVTILSMCLRHL